MIWMYNTYVVSLMRLSNGGDHKNSKESKFQGLKRWFLKWGAKFKKNIYRG